MKYVYRLVALYFFVPYCLIAQPINKLKLDVHVHESTIGVIEPLTLTVELKNEGKRTIKNINNYNGLYFFFRHEGDENWIRLYASRWPISIPRANNRDKLDIEPKGSFYKINYLLFPTLNEYSFAPVDSNIDDKRFISMYYSLSGACFKPGKYELRVAYFTGDPKIKRGTFLTTLECGNCILKQIPFEVAEYKNLESIEALELLSQLEALNMVYLFDTYYPTHELYAIYYLFGNRKKIFLTYEQVLEQLPNSKFSPFAAYHLAMKLRAKPRALFGEYSKRKIESYFQFILDNSDNPFLLEKVTKEIEYIQMSINKDFFQNEEK